MEPSIQTEVPKSPIHTVTPLSKYLALALFIILPFLGGWIGYTWAPERVVEVERVVDENFGSVNQETTEKSVFLYNFSKDGRDYYLGTTTIKGHLQSTEQEMGYDPSVDFQLWFVVDQEEYSKFAFRDQTQTEKFKSRPLIQIDELRNTIFYKSILEKCAMHIVRKEYCTEAYATSSPMEITITNLSVGLPGSRGEVFIADLISASNYVASGTDTHLISETIDLDMEIGDSNDIFPVVEFSCTTKHNPYPHRCYKLVDQQNNIIIENLTELAKTQKVISTNDRVALYSIVYKSSDSDRFYFKTGIPDSDGCCRLVRFTVSTQKFSLVNEWHGLSLSILSNNGRYVASAIEDGHKIRLYDLEKETVLYEDQISVGSLISTQCGFFGTGSPDITFSQGDKKMFYKIHDEQKLEADDCGYEVIEGREYLIL